ncbi:MAG: hypothetical protein ABI471_04570 [Sphingomonas bacterium]
MGLQLDLSVCFGQTDRGITFDAERAVRSVYTHRGQKYVFVFNQNLRRTNLQIAELLALLRLHTHYEGDRDQARVEGIEFSTFSETTELFASAVGGIREINDENLASFYEEISHQVDTKLLVELFYGSASVYLPQHLTLDLALICGESGYIHSCGQQVLLRNVEKATEEEFTTAISDAFYLRKQGEKFLLVPYCHEDFSVKDRGYTPFLEYGLDDLKINMAKAYVGSTRLHELVNEIGDTLRKSLLVAPSNYKDSASVFQKKFEGEEMNTIWIVTDSTHNLPDRFPGSKKFYILYLQEYKGSNYYHFYDENKPAWASHTTLPHSLAGALINLARPHFPRHRPAQIADPFCGSGTTFLEAQKFENIACHLSDRAAIFDFIVRDNVEFFQLTKRELTLLAVDLQQFFGVAPETPAPAIRSQKGRAQEFPSYKLHRIRTLVDNLAVECGNDFLRLPLNKLAPHLSSKIKLIDRVLFYLSLRVSVRGWTDIARMTTTWQSYFQRELVQLISQIENHAKNVSEDSVRISTTSRIVKANGTYSPSVYPDRPILAVNDLFSSIQFSVADITVLEPGLYDAIITDPPYGFNTDEDYWELARFVREMIPKLIESLKPQGGQLLLAAPQASFSGRVVIPFVRSLLLGREVIKWCSKNGRECVNLATVLPQDLSSIRPPYYWIAEKTLQRKILHFWVRRVEDGATTPVY